MSRRSEKGSPQLTPLSSPIINVTNGLVSPSPSSPTPSQHEASTDPEAKEAPSEALSKNPSVTIQLFLAPLMALCIYVPKENILANRILFQIFLGWGCYLRSIQKDLPIGEKVSLLEQGETLGNYLCTDRLNAADRQLIDTAATKGYRLPSYLVVKIIHRAQQAATLHYAVGFSLLAETCFRLARYHEKLLLKARGLVKKNDRVIEDSIIQPTKNCHTDHQKKSDKPIVKMSCDDERFCDPHNDLYPRYAYYTLAVTFITAAISIERDLKNITYIATGGQGISYCSWYHQDRNLHDTRLFYQSWMHSARLDKQISEAIQYGEDLARCMMNEQQINPH